MRDHRRYVRNFKSSCKKKAFKANSGLKGIRTRDLCDTDAVLEQLCYQVGSLRTSFTPLSQVKLNWYKVNQYLETTLSYHISAMTSDKNNKLNILLCCSVFLSI